MWYALGRENDEEYVLGREFDEEENL